jgi:hypothetical protein
MVNFLLYILILSQGRNAARHIILFVSVLNSGDKYEVKIFLIMKG